MKLLFTYICLIFIYLMPAIAQSDLRVIHRNKARSLNLEGSLHLLNLCQEAPVQIQEIFKQAFLILNSDPKATFSDVSRNDKFLELCLKNDITHTGGPMLGNITPSGANMWVRTLQPAKVEVKIMIDGTLRTYGLAFSNELSDLTAVVQVRGLEPGQKYPYQVFIDDKPASLGFKPSLTTPPADNDAETTRIAFGTCYHRWGLCNQSLTNQIRSRYPLALLLGGDIAVQDRRNNIAMHRADYLLRDFHFAWKSLVGSVPVYAVWDDHDYFDDDLYNIPAGFTLEDKESVSDIFRVSWNNPPYGSGQYGKGVYFRTRIGPADIIMLDGRYFRERGSLLGNVQMEWLKEQLLDCKGPFIILSNGTMWSDYVSGGKDSWGVHDPEGREQIFSLIEKNKIGGVLLISGDRHGSRGFRIPRYSGFNFYEFEIGSLGGRLGPPPIQPGWETQLFGISGEYAFGEFEFKTNIPDPEVTFRLIDDRGNILYAITLTRNQLTPDLQLYRNLDPALRLW